MCQKERRKEKMNGKMGLPIVVGVLICFVHNNFGFVHKPTQQKLHVHNTAHKTKTKTKNDTTLRITPHTPLPHHWFIILKLNMKALKHKQRDKEYEADKQRLSITEK